MRLVTSVAVLCLCLPAPVRAAPPSQGPPYDTASRGGNAATGVVTSVYATACCAPDEGFTGSVGIVRQTGPGTPRAWALIDVSQLSVMDPDAAVCVRIKGDGLPNNVEGGGPVCQRLRASPDQTVATRRASPVLIETWAELSSARTVSAEVFGSWLSVPGETGASSNVLRAIEIGFDPA